MPSREDSYRKIAAFFGRNALWLICLGLCVLAYVTYARVDDSRPWLKILLLHFATASFIAFFLDLFFEYNFRLRHLERWGSNVLQAVAGTLVPSAVVTELVAILKSEIVRKNCIYTITFLPAPDDADDRSFMLKRDLTYTACNTISRRIPFSITSSLENVSGCRHTKHLKLKVDGHEIGDIASLTKRTGVYESLTYAHGGGLKPNEEITVFISGQELVDLGAKQNSYILMKPCESLEIDPRNSHAAKIARVSVRMHHPVNDEMLPDDNGRYKFPHAMLPGQGFDVVWEVKQESVKREEGGGEAIPFPPLLG